MAIIAVVGLGSVAWAGPVALGAYTLGKVGQYTIAWKSEKDIARMTKEVNSVAAQPIVTKR